MINTEPNLNDHRRLSKSHNLWLYIFFFYTGSPQLSTGCLMTTQRSKRSTWGLLMIRIQSPESPPPPLAVTLDTWQLGHVYNRL